MCTICVSWAAVVSDRWETSEGVQQFVSSFRESLVPVPESESRYGETVAGKRWPEHVGKEGAIHTKTVCLEGRVCVGGSRS